MMQGWQIHWLREAICSRRCAVVVPSLCRRGVEADAKMRPREDGVGEDGATDNEERCDE